MSEFKYLFSPLKIGPVTVKNRIYSTAHTSGYPRDNLPSERLAYYHAEKAKGGVGLTTLGGAMAHPSSNCFGDKLIAAYDKRSIPGYRKLVGMVHDNGAKIFAQIFHAGVSATGFDSWLPLWGPSQVPFPATREIPMEMNIEQIKELLEGYCKSVENLKESGFDGIEVHCAHAYGLMQFLSPLFNKRKDMYGGSLENRMRLLLEVVDGVRERVGRELAVGVKVTGDELTPGGFTLEDIKVVAQKLEATGKVDYICVSAGNPYTRVLQIAPMYVPPGHIVYMAAAIKEVVDIPVFTIGRITDPVQAEKILADGKADMVGMTRALIADPELPNKARAGRLDDIRACVGDRQECAPRWNTNYGISCIQNPTVGREKEWGIGTLKPANRRKKVMVVGGGPGGMEAARVAKLRGHEVVLYEKEDELGGQVNLAAKLPGRDEIANVVRWLEIQIKKLGVKVVLGEEVTLETVERVNPDAVVIATGARRLRKGFTGYRPTLEAIPGSEQDNVLLPEDILKGKAEVGRKVVIYDEEGHIEALGIAELLAAEGRDVEIVSRMLYIGPDLDATSRGAVYSRNLEKGVKLSPHTALKEISGETVLVFDTQTKKERKIENVDAVVLTVVRRARNELNRQLKGKVTELYAVGDCVAPRRIDRAIYEGHKIGRLL